MKLEEVVLLSLGVLNTLKVYHWRSKTYKEHKISDDLYDELQTHIDDLVENVLGMEKRHLSMRGTQTITINTAVTKKAIRKYLTNYKHALIQFSELKNASSVNNTVDEILVKVNQFLYLLNL